MKLVDTKHNGYRIAGNFRGCIFLRKSNFPAVLNSRGFNFRFLPSSTVQYLTTAPTVIGMTRLSLFTALLACFRAAGLIELDKVPEGLGRMSSAAAK